MNISNALLNGFFSTKECIFSTVPVLFQQSRSCLTPRHQLIAMIACVELSLFVGLFVLMRSIHKYKINRMHDENLRSSLLYRTIDVLSEPLMKVLETCRLPEVVICNISKHEVIAKTEKIVELREQVTFFIIKLNEELLKIEVNKIPSLSVTDSEKVLRDRESSRFLQRSSVGLTSQLASRCTSPIHASQSPQPNRCDGFLSFGVRDESCSAASKQNSPMAVKPSEDRMSNEQVELSFSPLPDIKIIRLSCGWTLEVIVKEGAFQDECARVVFEDGRTLIVSFNRGILNHFSVQNGALSFGGEIIKNTINGPVQLSCARGTLTVEFEENQLKNRAEWTWHTFQKEQHHFFSINKGK